MKRNIYGKKMFIADLIVVSVWAFFFSRYCSPELLPLIPIRIALSFEMNRKSPWTMVSATGFLLSYLSISYFTNPFERMLSGFLCAIGESDLMIDIFSYPLAEWTEAWISSFSVLWFIWLAVLPVVVGWRLHNVTSIRWKKIWIWPYMIILTALSVWVMFEELLTGGFILGLGISALPPIYWCIYNRRGRSPIQLILNDKKIVWYLLYVALILSAFTIGLKDIYSLKLIGIVIFPALFYVMLTLSLHLGRVLTRCCIALSVSGLLYRSTLDNGETASIAMLVIAAALIVYAGATMIIRSKKWGAPLTLMTVVPIVIIPFTLGLNPYIILDAEHTRTYASNLSVRQGVYVVERYAELAEESTPDYWCIKHGLRDRYGLILPMEYDELKVIDGCGRYIATNYHLRYGSPKSDQRYGVFDLKERKFVVNPDSMPVAEIERIDDRSYKLIDPEGNYFATLYLWDNSRMEYYYKAHIEPHSAD